MKNPARLIALIEHTAKDGVGVTFQPIREGDPIGGWGSEEYAESDAWEVGYITHASGGTYALEATLDEAVEAAWRVVDAE